MTKIILPNKDIVNPDGTRIDTTMDIQITDTTKSDFINAINSKPNLDFKLRKNFVLIEQKTILNLNDFKIIIPSTTKLGKEAPIETTIDELNSKIFTVIKVGSNVEDIEVQSTPLIDWSNTMALRYIDLKGNKRTYKNLREIYYGLSSTAKKELLISKKEFYAIDYILAQEYAIIGTYESI
jgi:hypothetical protein